MSRVSQPYPHLLAPLRATAHRCGWAWEEPFLTFGMNGATDEAIAAEAGRYAARLASWRAERPRAARAA